jgi:drug/metabolite transporter (DMT)-like permease
MSSKDWFRFWAAGLIWSTSFLWIKIAVSEVSPLVLVGFRTLFAFLGILVFILAGKSIQFKWHQVRPHLGVLVLIGLLNVALPFVLISWGEQYISSGVASTLNSTTPLFTAILATFLLQDDRITMPKFFGLLVGFAGVVVLFLPEFYNQATNNLFGLAAVLIASFFYGISGILIKRFAKGIPSELMVLFQFGFASLFTWSVALMVEQPVVFPVLPLTWIALLWLGLLASSLASLYYFALIRSIGPTRATMVTYVPPLFGLLLGTVILDERLGWQVWLGGLMILVGIAVVNFNRKQMKKAAI